MKVLNLQCSHAHGFEGWFGSEDDFQDQLARGLVECPLCGDTGVTKLPSAPRLNLGASEPAAPAAAPQGKQEVMSSPTPELQAAWMQLVKQVMTHTEDVGENFAEEARKIHYGESEERGIRGQASKEETRALLEEGINVLPLPIPKGMKGPLQ
ncbi:DUF1178 family protein [Ramlibacter ginsenosidimutans]|uniref:DUF1178 family protein n=1 Tax=Ramlibacter ginsenosidimutans TaxID=502333 RepID=A0A934TXL2_9BURK|nr:DUF1178 family protein [Ramlibacter ginsenosidimutans]MBK6009354.1 DUF1178 family protein [Ramlibacter ginsenosidimutans]